MIKNIIFDFDGVLVDSEVLVARAFCLYFKKKDIIFSEKEFSYFAGHKTIDVIEDLSKKFDIKDKKIFYDNIMDLANNIFKTDLRSINGVKFFLNNINKKVFIGSNSGKKRIIEGLKQTNLMNYFEDSNIFSFDMVKNPKPSPDVYLKVLEDSNIDREETIVIEDSVIGSRAGISAGIKVIGFTGGSHWYKDRDVNALKNEGVFLISNNYDHILKVIDNL